MFFKDKEKAFTILELIVVLAIVATIATITIIAINPDEQLKKAKTSKLVSQFNQIEKAFIFAFLDEGRSTWWTESELDIGANPTLKKIIDIETGPLSTFSDYFPHEGVVDELTDSQYQYDHDSNAPVDCSGGNSNWHKGSNLAVTGLTLAQKEEIDLYIDKGGDFKCGKVTYGNYEGGSLYWRMNAE